jgi:hypothetical protein
MPQQGASAPKSALLKGLLIGLGGAVPVILMRVTANGYVQFFVVFSLLFAILVSGLATFLLVGVSRLPSCLRPFLSPR